MPRFQSLDEVIGEKAVEFADQMRAAAAMAAKEEEIRIETERLLALIEKDAGITLEGRHEFTVASGRIDSVYDRVIIEYKNPARPSNRIGPKRDSPGSRKVVEQIQKRFYDMRVEHGRPLNTLFGVGLDGRRFIFVRFRDDRWDVQEPVDVNKHSAERFLWALFNLGTKGKAFTPDYLAGDFGAGAKLAQDGVRALYEAIRDTENPKARTFFNQWKILFGEVCGYDVDSPSAKIKKLADSYGVRGKGVKPAELLFALHSYYAIFMKLLASEIVAFFHKLPTPLQKMMKAPTSNKLKREMEDLELGGIFQHFHITNFLEGDLFAWYTSVWSEPIDKLVRDMVARLDNYNPGTISEDPAVSRDLLKKLYHQLFPKSVRHDLGEYYTPDWLAELVLDELGYEGDPDKRLLDPACGSGTFLVMAINRIQHWYDKNRENRRYGEAELCRKILANVIGFDLNPLAVMAARTNYLIAMRGLLSHAGEVELPVYLCDSILTPAEYGERHQKEMLGRPMQLRTGAKPTPFFIPREVTTDRGILARYTNLLAQLSPVASGYSPREFLQRVADEGLPCRQRDDHLRLFEELRELDREQKNGVWARIIKNAFAPLFVHRVDYVAGNPPWVNWENLPNDYRQSTAPLWQQYDLFRHKGYKAKLGGGKDDVSILMTYVAHDAYLAEGGRLGFVITQSVFKTVGGGEGFRSFEYEADGTKWFLSPLAVHDLSDFQPFEGATNRTAVIIVAKKRRSFAYPVPYTVWKKTVRGKIAPELELNEVRAATARRKVAAQPVRTQERTSPWLTAPKQALSGIQKVIGQSDYKAYEGVNTGGLNGCYWIRILKKLPSGDLLIENLHDVGKIKVEKVQAAIEPDLVYPLLRGRDVHRWRAEPSAHIILANRTDKLAGIPESTMKRRWPKTYAYLKQFEGDPKRRERGTLWGRASSSVVKLMETGAFYSMFAVGPYTMAKWKVIWPEVGHSVRAGVSGPSTVEKAKPSLPDHTIVAVSCNSESEAYFVAGVLNSSPAHVAAAGYIVLHPSPHIMQNIAVPKFKKTDINHTRLAELSRQCHTAAGKNNEDKIAELEAEIDRVAAGIWGITAAELKAIQKALDGSKARNKSPVAGG